MKDIITIEEGFILKVVVVVVVVVVIIACNVYIFRKIFEGQLIHIKLQAKAIFLKIFIFEN